MFTLYIHYTLDPNKLDAFGRYVRAELPVLARSGGAIVGYFLPTDFAGPTNEAHGLIDFPDLATYERYRAVLAADPDHVANAEALERSGAVLGTARSIVRRAALM